MKYIPGYEGFYKIDKNGNVFSCRRQKFLTSHVGTSGYLQITLQVNNNRKNPSVHRLVMLTFIGQSELEVNHIDGNKLNNRLENLEYCTPKENMKHAKSKGLTPNRKGDRTGMAKLSEDKILEIRDLFNQGKTNVYIANKYNVAPNTISTIRHKKTWWYV